MNKKIIEFGKRMDSAQDKETLISFCEGAKSVLDLGAGTGAMARAISEKYGSYVDAVDCSFKLDEMPNSEKVKYYGMSIEVFLTSSPASFYKKYDRIILSGVLHELNDNALEIMSKFLPRFMTDNCRILIREPLYDNVLGPVLKDNEWEFFNLVSSSVSSVTMVEYMTASKVSSEEIKACGEDFDNSVFWANLAFVLSYGKDSWLREKHEYRYARSINWAKTFFNFKIRPYTGFQVYTILDKTYRQHFINAGIPGEAFDLLQYTGLHIIIDYSK